MIAVLSCGYARTSRAASKTEVSRSTIPARRLSSSPTVSRNRSAARSFRLMLQRCSFDRGPSPSTQFSHSNASPPGKRRTSYVRLSPSSGNVRRNFARCFSQSTMDPSSPAVGRRVSSKLETTYLLIRHQGFGNHYAQVRLTTVAFSGVVPSVSEDHVRCNGRMGRQVAFLLPALVAGRGRGTCTRGLRICNGEHSMLSNSAPSPRVCLGPKRILRESRSTGSPYRLRLAEARMSPPTVHQEPRQ